jgi:hypothetical protein
MTCRVSLFSLSCLLVLFGCGESPPPLTPAKNSTAAQSTDGKSSPQQRNHSGDAVGGSGTDTGHSAELPPAAPSFDNTIIYPAVQGDIIARKNSLWCATFQFTWAKLAEILKGPPDLSGAPATAELLNARQFLKPEIDEKHFVAFAGRGAPGLEQLKLELARKFPTPSKLLPESLSVDDVILYARFSKTLPFETPLTRFDKPLLFGSTNVECFGLAAMADAELWDKRAKQIIVMHYAAPDDFIVQLQPKEADEKIFIARLDYRERIYDVIGDVLKRIGASSTKPSPLNRDDTLQIPLIDIDLARHFPDLEGRQIRNDGFTTFVLKEAKQSITFKFDETGAALDSSAAVILAKNGHTPRRMICDGPFLVLLQLKRARMPYFACWVENPEVLVKWKVQPTAAPNK